MRRVALAGLLLFAACRAPEARLLCVYDPPGADWRKAKDAVEAHKHDHSAVLPLGALKRCPVRGRLKVETAGRIELTVGSARLTDKGDVIELATLGIGRFPLRLEVDGREAQRFELEVVEGR